MLQRLIALQESSSNDPMALSGPKMRQKGVLPIAEGLRERRTLAKSKIQGTWAPLRVVYYTRIRQFPLKVSILLL